MRVPRWSLLAGLGGLAALPLVAARRIPGVSTGPTIEPPREDGYWLRTIPPLPRFRSLATDIDVDVAVVGGGWTGLASAYYLSSRAPGLRVALLEAQRLGSGASSRNSGAASVRFRGRAPDKSARRGYDLLKAFAEREGVDFDLVESIPAMTLYRRAPSDRSPDLTRDELAKEIGSPFYEAAEVYTTNELHPGKLIAALIDANVRHGTQLYEWSPVLKVDRGKPVVLHTPAARVRARDVVLATNAYTPQLGFAQDVMLTMHHRVIATRPLTDAEWRLSGLERWPFRVEDGAFYTHTVRTTPDRRFFFRHVLGHRAFERTDWPLDAAAARVGQRELLRRYPWLKGIPIEYEWHGVTARTRDMWPVTGQLDEHIYIAAGFNGSGVVPTHYFGYLVAMSILGIPDDDLALLSPPERHPRIPGELLRHGAFHGWLMYRRLRDGC